MDTAEKSEEWILWGNSEEWTPKELQYMLGNPQQKDTTGKSEKRMDNLGYFWRYLLH